VHIAKHSTATIEQSQGCGGSQPRAHRTSVLFPLNLAAPGQRLVRSRYSLKRLREGTSRSWGASKVETELCFRAVNAISEMACRIRKQLCPGCMTSL
jgi:hypothetical protein